MKKQLFMTYSVSYDPMLQSINTYFLPLSLISWCMYVPFRDVAVEIRTSKHVTHILHPRHVPIPDWPMRF